jgi:hypothetical protein
LDSAHVRGCALRGRRPGGAIAGESKAADILRYDVAGNLLLNVARIYLFAPFGGVSGYFSGIAVDSL